MPLLPLDSWKCQIHRHICSHYTHLDLTFCMELMAASASTCWVISQDTENQGRLRLRGREETALTCPHILDLYLRTE